ncbi:MAG: nitroreductase family protein [Cyanobacteriota bacterium]
MELTKVIKERCCNRQFSDKKPSREQLLEILKAGQLAPSWVNVQPWHFIIVQDKETIKLLGELSFGQPHVSNANTLIVCCGTLDSWNPDNYKDIISSRPNITQDKIDRLLNSPAFNPKLLGDDTVIMRTVEEVTYAIAYMTLEIENQGLSGCIIGGMGNTLTKSNLDIYKETTKKLNLPEDVIIVAMLVVGYPDEEKPPKSRKELFKIVSLNTFGNPF